MTETYGNECAMSALLSERSPKAFLATAILPTIEIRRAATECGLKMGKNISLITHDDELSCMKNSGRIPMFTATQSSVREAGKRSAKMLLDIINDPEQAPKQELWEYQLILAPQQAHTSL